MGIRVVLVDDAEEIREAVRAALLVRGGFDIVGEAADGLGAVDVVGRTRPDVIVLDLGLPDLSGKEVISRIRLVSPESGVVVFTGTYLDDKLGVRPFVEGYLLKDRDLELLGQVLNDVGSSADGRAPVVLELPRDTRSPARARRFVGEQCRTWGFDQLANDAELIVSELVTNAVTHAESTCQVRLFRSGQRLRIEVIDDGAGTPDMRSAARDDEHGRGLVLVSMLSGAWGVDSVPSGGKRVWGDLLATSGTEAER